MSDMKEKDEGLNDSLRVIFLDFTLLEISWIVTEKYACAVGLFKGKVGLGNHPQVLVSCLVNTS